MTLTSADCRNPNVRFLLNALIRGLLVNTSFMYSFIITIKTEISKYKRLLHNRTTLDILCFLKVRFQRHLLHFHCVIHGVACQCRWFFRSCQQGNTQGQRTTTAYNCAHTEVSFINWCQPRVLWTTSLIRGVEEAK